MTTIAGVAIMLAAQLSHAKSIDISTTPSILPQALSSAVSISLSAVDAASKSSLVKAMPTHVVEESREEYLRRILHILPAHPSSDPMLAGNHLAAAITDLVVAVSGGEPSPQDLSPRAGPFKVMIVGDSMTHGLQGDWTWRYRLWQWFDANGIDINLVGPYKGTQIPTTLDTPHKQPPLYGSPNPAPTIDTSGGYAADCNPNFDSDHFGASGRPMAIAQTLIKDMVTQYQPDMLLVMLGINDFMWGYSDAAGLIKNAHNFIVNARQTNPTIKVAMSNVPMGFWPDSQGLIHDIDSYNAQIPVNLSGWSTEQSPVTLVDIRGNYSCDVNACPAGRDGLHPGSLGDYEIAAAFSTVLNKVYGLGSSPLKVPSNPPSRPVPVPSNLTITSSVNGVTARWSPVYGAYAYYVQTSTNGGVWSATQTVTTNRWEPIQPISGTLFAIRVATYCGILPGLTSAYTDAKSGVAKPQLPSPPRSVNAYSFGSSLAVYFDPPVGPYSDNIIEYEVIVWDGCGFPTSGGFTSSPAKFNGLTIGHTYTVAVNAWNAAGGQGYSGFGNDVRIGNTTFPPRVTDITIQLAGANYVKATWSGSQVVAGYHVYLRNTLNSSDVRSLYATTDRSCWADFIWYPANWCYEYCFEAFNGGLVSGFGRAQCVQPSQPPVTDYFLAVGCGRTGQLCPA